MPSDAFLLTVPEAARRLRVSDSMVRKLVRDGRLRSVKLGRRVLVPVAAVNELIAGRTDPPTGQTTSRVERPDPDSLVWVHPVTRSVSTALRNTGRSTVA